MIVRIVGEAEFFSAFPDSPDVFSSQAFTDVNIGRAEAVRFFVGFDEGKPVAGIILGLRDGAWHCPFSAPFGQIIWRSAPSLEHIYDFVSELADMLAGREISITLPPAFYNPQALTPAYGILANFARKTYWDFNYHYPLEHFPDFEARLDRAARKNFHRAKEQGFVFEATSDIARCYAVIKANRDSKGYPLAMSLGQVEATVRPLGPVEADFFVMSRQGKDVAAAMAYHVAEGIVQIVYWGDAPGFSAMRPMNILPYHIFGHYYECGERIVDVGPSSSRGIPSVGLCRFKRSIGCELSLKPTMIVL